MADDKQTVSVKELAKYPLFQDLRSAEIVQFLAAARVRSFNDAHPIIFREGDPGDGMYMVLSGAVDVYSTDTAGRNNLLNRFEEGDFFGEMTLLEAKGRSATAKVMGDTRVIFLSREAFAQLQEKEPGVLVKVLLRIMAEMSGRLRNVTQRYSTAKAALTSLQSF